MNQGVEVAGALCLPGEILAETGYGEKGKTGELEGCEAAASCNQPRRQAPPSFACALGERRGRRIAVRAKE